MLAEWYRPPKQTAVERVAPFATLAGMVAFGCLLWPYSMLAMGLIMDVCNLLRWPRSRMRDAPPIPFPMIPAAFHIVFVIFLGAPFLTSLAILVGLLAFSLFCYPLKALLLPGVFGGPWYSLDSQDAVKAYIVDCVRPTERTSLGQLPPLHAAAGAGRPFLSNLVLLLTMGADRGQFDASGRTAAQVAQEAGNDLAANLLTQYDDEAVKACVLAQVGRRQRALLEQLPPLHAVAAAGWRFEWYVRLLLQMGADPTGLDAAGRTAVDVAVENENYDAARLIFYHDPQAVKSHILDLWGHKTRTRLEHLPPLHVAAGAPGVDSPAHVRGLLDAGADPLERDAEGRTALQVAVAAGNEDAARVLADYAGGHPQ